MALRKVGNVDDWPVARQSDEFIAWCPECHHGYPNSQAVGQRFCAGSVKNPHEPVRLVTGFLLRIDKYRDIFRDSVGAAIEPEMAYIRLKFDPAEDDRIVHHEDPPIERVEENGRLKCNGKCG